MSQVRPINPRLQYFEDALQKTGWGLYYKFLVGFTAMNLFANGLVLLSIYFAIPLSACDIMFSEDNITTIHVCYVLGKAIGGFFLCSVSDNTGKKCMISKSLIIIFGSCFVSAFSHNIYTLYLAAFFLGSGLQTNIVSIKIYLSEILPSDKRGFYTVLPDIFWTIGYFVTSGCMYFFSPASTKGVEHQGMDMRLTFWRIIFAIGGGLCITMACTSALLEMGPRYLLFKRRIITATLVLKQFYAINKSKYSETFDIHSQQLHDLVSDYNINIDPEPVGLIQQINILIKVMLRMIRILMRRHFIKIALTICFIKLPGVFGIAGMNVFLTQHYRHENTSQIRGCDFVHLTLTYQNSCITGFNSNEFRLFLMISINILIGQILLLFIIDKIGRKYPIFAALVTCAFTSLILAYNKDFTVAVISSSLFIIGYTIIESALFVVVIESFPTAIRGTAAGLTTFYNYIASCFIYKFLYMNHQDFFTVLTATIIGTSLFACFIPELSRRPMVE